MALGPLRHLGIYAKRITLGYMNVSTVGLSPAYRKGVIPPFLTCLSGFQPSQTDYCPAAERKANQQ